MKSLYQLLILFFFLLLLVACGDIEFLTSSGKSGAEEEFIYVKSPSLTLYKASIIDKVIKAQEGKFNEKTQKLELGNVKSEFYEQGKFVAELSAESGILFLQDSPKEGHSKNDIVAEGNVVYKNVDGSMLKTNSLLWDNKKQLLSSESEFTLERPTENGIMIVSGKRFETDKTLTKWQYYGASTRLVQKKE